MESAQGRVDVAPLSREVISVKHFFARKTIFQFNLLTFMTLSRSRPSPHVMTFNLSRVGGESQKPLQ